MIDLMSLLLKFDPDERITVEQALEHSLLEELHHPPEEVTFSLFEDPWDKLETTGSAITLEKWKEILRGEIKVFNPVTVTSTRRRSPNSQGAAYSQ
jgi:serine/threonine protein kinase